MNILWVLLPLGVLLLAAIIYEAVDHQRWKKTVSQDDIERFVRKHGPL